MSQWCRRWLWLGFCDLRDSFTMSSSQTAWEAVPRMILRPTLHPAYDLDSWKKQKLMVYFKNQIELIFCKLIFIALPHYVVLCKAVIRHQKNSQKIKFECISNKDFCHIDLLCWERPLCQANRSIVGFKADQCTGLLLVWVHPDMVKEGLWGAGQQLCSKALSRQTGHE